MWEENRLANGHVSVNHQLVLSTREDNKWLAKFDVTN
jgi:hypothetical protein